MLPWMPTCSSRATTERKSDALRRTPRPVRGGWLGARAVAHAPIKVTHRRGAEAIVRGFGSVLPKRAEPRHNVYRPAHRSRRNPHLKGRHHLQAPTTHGESLTRQRPRHAAQD
jgi:hypothetical protein